MAMTFVSALLWLLLMAALFVGFTVQGAMWSAAQEQNRNGWVIALIWSVASLIVIIGIRAAEHAWLASHQCLP
jgi:predicted membrane-bound mannosyltransferase